MGNKASKIKMKSSAGQRSPLQPLSDDVTRNGDVWTVAGIGNFTHMASYNFSERNDLPGEMRASDHTVFDTASGSPFDHQFDPALVSVKDGFLNLKVPGGQDTSPLQCAEVQTMRNDILYASVRTNAIFSPVPGVCHGLFLYGSPNHETDIEYLTSPPPAPDAPPSSRAPPYLLYTNQPTTSGVKSTSSICPCPHDASRTIHEYRIDWVPGQTVFYVDGVVQKTLTENVPFQGGQWMWNNWSNGEWWFMGNPPPAGVESVLRIRDIVMYFNVQS